MTSSHALWVYTTPLLRAVFRAAGVDDDVVVVRRESSSIRCIRRTCAARANAGGPGHRSRSVRGRSELRLEIHSSSVPHTLTLTTCAHAAPYTRPCAVAAPRGCTDQRHTHVGDTSAEEGSASFLLLSSGKTTRCAAETEAINHRASSNHSFQHAQQRSNDLPRRARTGSPSAKNDAARRVTLVTPRCSPPSLGEQFASTPRSSKNRPARHVFPSSIGRMRVPGSRWPPGRRHHSGRPRPCGPRRARRRASRRDLAPGTVHALLGHHVAQHPRARATPGRETPSSGLEDPLDSRRGTSSATTVKEHRVPVPVPAPVACWRNTFMIPCGFTLFGGAVCTRRSRQPRRRAWRNRPLRTA